MDKMIQANELRMGNWIDMGREGICQVTGYNIYMIYLTCNGAYTAEFYKEIKPIPLTEEWLLKYGFELSKHRWYKKQYNSYAETCQISINTTSFRFAIEEVTDNATCAYAAYKVHYVHQLQNLYFALTGEELTNKTI